MTHWPFSNFIFAADAEDGTNGQNGQDGTTGNDGGDGTDGGFTDCSSSFAAGMSGTNSCNGQNTSGGLGASNNCPSYEQYQPAGQDGNGSAPGLGGVGACDGYIYRWGSGCGTCSLDPNNDGNCWGVGSVGTDGGDGNDGTGGAGALINGQLSGYQWASIDGTAGTSGTDGSGGGGGGTGSGAEVRSCFTSSNPQGYEHAGGTGGGGGAGGCGGENGNAGTGGGSSFAVIFECTGSCTNLPVFIDNEIEAEMVVMAVKVEAVATAVSVVPAAVVGLQIETLAGAGDGGAGGNGGEVVQAVAVAAVPEDCPMLFMPLGLPLHRLGSAPTMT